MPKKPRQAHIPSQITRRRKVRRIGDSTSVAPDAPVFADPPAFVAPGGQAPVAAAPIAPVRPARAGRRMELIRAPQQAAGGTGGIRVVPGQLPTFERAYLMRELRQISITAGSLLAVIIALTIVLR